MSRVYRLFQIHEALSRGEPPLDAHDWGQVFDVNVRTILRDMAFLKNELKAPVIFDPRLRGYRYEQTKKELMSEVKTKKWARLLTLIHRICAEPGKTAKELAEATGRTERTIFRDIRELEDSGLPIYNDNGYRFAADAFLPNLNLSPTELFSLFVAVRLLESQNGGDLGAEARRALEKFLRTTSETKRPDLGTLRDSIQVKESEEETGAGMLAPMQEALSSGRQLELSYQGMKDDAPKKRLLDPMGLFCFRQVWYLHAYDHERKALRNYRLSRVSDARLTERQVLHEARLELDEASYHKWDVEGDEKKVLVRIRVTPALARWLEENPAHPSQVSNEDEVHYKVSNPVAMARWVTSLYGLEVLEPDSLRNELRRVSRELFEMYGDD